MNDAAAVLGTLPVALYQIDPEGRLILVPRRGGETLASATGPAVVRFFFVEQIGNKRVPEGESNPGRLPPGTW